MSNVKFAPLLYHKHLGPVIRSLASSFTRVAATRITSMRRDVRILLVGDGSFLSLLSRHNSDEFNLLEGVGKSTIVTSFIKEDFVPHVCFSHLSLFIIITNTPSLPQVQHVVPEVTISPEVTPENVTTYIVDSGGRSSG